jgi:hypothetical protein
MPGGETNLLYLNLLDTDFDWLRQKNKPRMANFPIENIAHERCNVLYCHIVRMAFLNCQDVS